MLKKDLIWGGAVAAHQLEGGWNKGGKGVSIADVLTARDKTTQRRITMALQGRNIQVLSAMKFFDDVKSNNNDSNIYLGGHSLGGGLALTVGIRRYYEI